MREKEKNMFPYGLRLREQRKKLKMTQEVFAGLGGVTVQTQRTYEAGRRAPDAEYLNKIAEKGADVQYIVKGSAAKELVRLPNFGTVTGLKFDNGGYAEVTIGPAEISRVLEALSDFEEEKGSPDQNMLDQLRSIRERYFDEGPELLLETVVGQYRVEFNWIPRED